MFLLNDLLNITTFSFFALAKSNNLLFWWSQFRSQFILNCCKITDVLSTRISSLLYKKNIVVVVVVYFYFYFYISILFLFIYLFNNNCIFRVYLISYYLCPQLVQCRLLQCNVLVVAWLEDLTL